MSHKKKLLWSLHCSSFLGLPYRILIIYLLQPKKGTTMETIGTMEPLGSSVTCQPYTILEVLQLPHGLQGKRACTRTVPDPKKYAE